MVAAPVPRASVPGPSGTIERDSATATGRRIGIRIRPMPGTLSIAVRSVGGRVVTASVDGRAIDRSRYRQAERGWFLDYAAPPDSGFILDLLVPTDSIPTLDLVAQQAGLPSIPGHRVPPRPPHVLPSQTGDVTLVHRVVRLTR